jgi:OmpA-OmpF porin, OOP family
MKLPKYIQPIILLVGGTAVALAARADYIGTLKIPGPPSAAPASAFTFSASSLTGLTPQGLGDNGYRLKLGYKYSRYLSVESEYVDVGTNAGTVFSSPANLASAFRQTGFGVDTVATVPLWRQFSFYGRLGAYTGSRDLFSTNPVSLLGGEGARGTRLRYGLGMRYDLTKSLGIRAEMERFSPLGSTVAGEPEVDLFSVGLMWRF